MVFGNEYKKSNVIKFEVEMKTLALIEVIILEQSRKREKSPFSAICTNRHVIVIVLITAGVKWL